MDNCVGLDSLSKQVRDHDGIAATLCVCVNCCASSGVCNLDSCYMISLVCKRNLEISGNVGELVGNQ